MTKKEVIELLMKVFDGCVVSVNCDNWELYDESPGCAIDYDAVAKRLQDILRQEIENGR